MTNRSSSPEWLNIGVQAELTRPPSARGPDRMTMALSDPVDIVEPGTYMLMAGPVGSGEPSGWMFPSDLLDAVRLEPAGVESLPTLVERDGQQFVTLTITVLEVMTPYRGLRVWFQ